MTVADIKEALKEATEGEAVLFDGLDEALIGICRRFGRPPVALYDYNKCIEIFMKDMEDKEPEQAYEMACEHFEFNTIGAWVGEYTPAFACFPEE
jgi:hypothetical protein